MGDHSLLLTESTIDDVIRKSKSITYSYSSSENEECRICHDEDQDTSMEIPCGCCGSLKYAHRICVQRWCNEKGNTTCEICLQPFEPDYTSPPPLFHYGGIPMNFRGNWEISRRDFYTLQFSSIIDTNHDSFDSDFDDYIAPSSTSLLCCRILTITLIILLVLRHTLPIIINGTGAYSITIFMLHLLMVIGILLPICIMARGLTAAQHRHQRPQDLPQTESQPHLIHVH